MQTIARAKLYDRTVQFMPYLKSLQSVLRTVAKNAPKRAHVLDVMCGTGYFLGLLHKRRPDLICRGTDIDEDNIGYANARYEGVVFEQADILDMDHEVPADVVTCTGAIHHIEYDLQPTAILNLASMVKPGGFAVISDCYIDNYSDDEDRKELERRAAAKKLGLAYLEYGIKKGAPVDVQEELLQILLDDMAMIEFKTSLERRRPILKSHFDTVRTICTWPGKIGGYGDYIHVCS